MVADSNEDWQTDDWNVPVLSSLTYSSSYYVVHRTPVVISLQFDLAASSPIPFARLHRRLFIKCFAQCILSLLHHVSFTQERVGRRRVNRQSPSPHPTLFDYFSLRFNSLGLRCALPKPFSSPHTYTSLRSIRAYLHVHPVSHLHLHLKFSVLLGPMWDGLHISIATPLTSRRSVLLARKVMVLVGRVAVHGQGGIGGLAAGRLVSRG